MIITHHGINSMRRGGQPLPAEYELLNYIKYNGGAAYDSDAEFWLPIEIDTNTDVDFIMTVRLNQSEYNNKPIFKVYTAGPSMGNEIIRVEIRREYNKAIFRSIKNGGSSKSFGGHNLTYCTSKHTYRLRNGEMYDEDLGVRLFSDASIYSPISVYKNFSPSVNIDGTGGGIEMYEYKVVLDGNILYDYVPVREKSTGYLGFYDLVNKTFTTLVQKQYLQYYSAG